jgi:hypothetical protein
VYTVTEVSVDETLGIAYQTPQEVPLSDKSEAENPTLKTVPIVIFNGHRSKIVMNSLRFGSDSMIGYKLMFSPSAILEGHLTVDDLAMLRSLLDEAIRQGIAVTTQVFEEPPEGV